VIFMRFI